MWRGVGVGSSEMVQPFFSFTWCPMCTNLLLRTHTISHLSPKHQTRTNLLTPTREMMVANTRYINSRR